jgi:hypothetical protein
MQILAGYEYALKKSFHNDLVYVSARKSGLYLLLKGMADGSIG